jgi:hypothetical protein
MSKPTKQLPDEPRKFLERYPDTRQLELLQPDMLGILRGKRVGREEFGKPFTGGLNFCGATVLLDAKGLTFDRIDNGGRDGDCLRWTTRRAGRSSPTRARCCATP